MLSAEEVKHIAKLARLGLTETEIAKFQKDLSAILDYVEKLKKVDVSGVEPTSRSVLVEDIMRKDEIGKKSKREKLLNQMPEVKDEYLKVKSILERR